MILDIMSKVSVAEPVPVLGSRTIGKGMPSLFKLFTKSFQGLKSMNYSLILQIVTVLY